MSDNKPAPDKPNHDHIEEFDLSNIQALLDAAAPGEHMVRALIPESSEEFNQISLEELLGSGNDDFVVTPDGTQIPTRANPLVGNNNNASNSSIPGQATNAQQQTYSQSHKIVTSLALPSSNAASPQLVAPSLPTTTASASTSLVTPSPVSLPSPQQSNVITRSNSKQTGPSGPASSPPPPRTVTVFTSAKPGLALPGQGSPTTVTSAPAGTHTAAPVRTSVQQLQHLEHMQQQHVQQQQQQVAMQQQMAMANNGSGNAPMSLLDSIKATLPKDRQDKMDELRHQLLTSELTAEGFLSQASVLLNQQQFQTLVNLTKQDPTPPIQHLPVGHPQLQSQYMMQSTNLSTAYMNNNATAAAGAVGPGRKRPADNIGQLMTPAGIGAVGTVVGAINPGLMTPQAKKFKTEHTFISPGMPMGPPPMPSGMIQTPRPMAPGVGRPPGAGTPSTPGGGDDKVDYDTLTDVMQYAGVDLKEESDRILQDADMSMTSIPDGVDRSRMQDFLNLHILRDLVQKIASPYLISNIDPDFLSYLALATQDRLRSVIEQMSLASKHRVKSQSFDSPPLDDTTGQPLYKIIVHSDIKKQLLAIERVEREEERRRREALSDRQNRAAGGDGDGGGGGSGGGGAAGGGGEDGGDGKPKKRRKEKEMGPGVTARNMSEDVRKKITNQTALMSAGGMRKSWMLAPAAPDVGGSKAVSSATESGGGGGSTAGSEGSGEGKGKGRGRGRGRSADGEDGRRGGKRAGRGRASMGGAGGSGAGSTEPLRDPVGQFLGPSTLGRGPRLGEGGVRKVTVRDALFALERDRGGGGGAGTGERVLLRAYAKWLK